MDLVQHLLQSGLCKPIEGYLLGKPFALISGEAEMDWYKPYDDIPHTAAIDPMEDNLLNRLLMFLGKFSDQYVQNERIGKPTPAKDQLSDASLIKWDNRSNDTILNIARKLIWVSHDPEKNTIVEFDKHWSTIKKAENELYTSPNRHIQSNDIIRKEEVKNTAIVTFLNRMPKVFDPFAGGGAIPLEASRLGCRSYGNDLNPVAHIVQKGSLEFPQKFGKPIIYKHNEFVEIYGKEVVQELPSNSILFEKGTESQIQIENRLSFDVVYHAKKILEKSEKKLEHYYPKSSSGKKTVAYLWARTGNCSNPSCKAEIPLMKRMNLVKTPNKKISLFPKIINGDIKFEIVNREHNESWINRGNLTCPVCSNTTDVNSLKSQFLAKETGYRMIAVIRELENGKSYELPSKEELRVFDNLPVVDRPKEKMPVKYTQALPSCTWGLNEWGQMLTDRQALFMDVLISELEKQKKIIGMSEYSNAIICYLGIFINRVAQRQTSYGIWDISRENTQAIFGRQAISMMFDFPEANPFSNSGGGALNQIDWIQRYIESESSSSFWSQCNNSSSGDKLQFLENTLDGVVTDPPYYDAIAYADLSDFFYAWFKRTISDRFPLVFSYPLTPKSEECTALKHHHDGNIRAAKIHFENKLTEIFSAINYQTKKKGICTIMFAHQTNEAWTTLCNSILNSNFNLTSSWALDTEYSFTGLKQNKAFLASSVTVSAKPFIKSGFGDFKEIHQKILIRIKREVKQLYGLGFRGADLLTACFGQAVSEFGQYEKVEKADGSEVTVEELLEMAKEAAFNAIVSDIETDDFTKFYIGWLNLFGFSEAEHDDVRRITQIGLSIDTSELVTNHILIRNGSKETLAEYNYRIEANAKLGLKVSDKEIDKAHRMMFLFKSPNRSLLIKYIAKMAPANESSLWRILNSLSEILPAGTDDHKQAIGLLAIKESLIRDAKNAKHADVTQSELDF